MFANGCAGSCAHHDPIWDFLGHRGYVVTPEPATFEAGTIGQVQKEWVASSYLPLACKRIFLEGLLMSVSYPSTMCNQERVAVIFPSTASGGLNTLCVSSKLCEQWLFSMVILIFYKSESSLLQHLCLGLISFSLCQH